MERRVPRTKLLIASIALLVGLPGFAGLAWILKTSHRGNAIPPGQNVFETASTPYCGPQTLAKLQYAYEFERCDSDVYTAYALQAEQEGYRSAASLLRAIASSELIHAMNHRSLLQACGVEPASHQRLTTVARTTSENLRLALMSEVQQQYERDPALIQVALSEGSKAAAQSFQLAQMAERNHLDLLGAVLAQPQIATAEPYRVCTVSGYISVDPQPAHCVGGEYGTIE